MKGKGSGKKMERFLALPHKMATSPAFRTLPPAAVAVLIDIWTLHTRDIHGNSNNGTLPYGVREAKEIGMSSSTASRNIEALIERGFLKVRRESSFGSKRTVREFEITGLECDGRDPTHDYLVWKPNRPRKRSDSPTSGTMQSHQRDTGPKNVIKLRK